MKLTTLAIVGAMSSMASAHYYVDTVNGDTSCLRPLVLYAENSPVTGTAIDTSAIMCGANPASANPAPSSLALSAGAKVSAHYNPGAYHVGPCAVYIAKKGTTAWAKIFENTYSNGKWCSDVITANNNVLDFNVPSSLAPGDYVFRVEHLGLHVAQTAGGAQFYIRCFDATVSGSGSAQPNYSAKFPGAYSSSTPGVVWDVYSGDQSKYPSIGPAVWNGSGTGTNNPPPQTTTTTTTKGTQPKPTTTTTTTTQAPPSPTSSGNCPNQKYAQCGGQGFSGQQCCASGSTCKVSNPYYSQCL